MLSCSLPVLLLVLFPLAAPINGALQKTHGVSPSLLSKYTPIKISGEEQWQCLDGSTRIPWAAVNDDYCDCSDGSDEPGVLYNLVDTVSNTQQLTPKERVHARTQHSTV